jgi:hypothetical protein
MAKANSVIDVILGEAKAGSYEDMLAIASVIQNRARQLGVSPEEVVSVGSEFNAYGKALPSGVDKYRDLATQALQQVQTQGPVHDATFYATPDASKRLPSGLDRVTSTDGHVFFSDPANRSIRTSAGFRAPENNLMSFAPLGPEPPASAPRNGQDAIEAALNVPNLRSRAANVAEANSAPLGFMPTLDSAFDYPLGQKETRVARGFAYGPENYDINRMDPTTAYSARRAFDNIGIDPTINSAFRSGVVPEKAKYDYNEAVGGKRHSQHKQGKALDISTRGMSDMEKAAMVDSLMAEGLGGIGVGRNIIHADTGAPRSWTYGNSVPDAVRSVMEARYEGDRLNRYPSDFGNIPAPTAKPNMSATPGVETLMADDRTAPPMASVDYASIPSFQNAPRYSENVSIVEPQTISPVQRNLSPIQSIDRPDLAFSAPSVPDFASVQPTQSDGLSLFSPIGPELSPVASYAPASTLGPRNAPEVPSVSASRFETAFSPFDAPEVQVASAPTPAPLTSSVDVPAIQPAQPAQEVQTGTVDVPGIDAPVIGGVGIPQMKPKAQPAPKAPNRFGKIAGSLVGGALGGMLGGPIGAIGGGFVGGRIGQNGLPGGIGLPSLNGFGSNQNTPLGMASRAATQGGGFNNDTFQRTYAQQGGAQDGRSYGKALAEEQRQRAAAGQKTIGSAFGGLFR